MLLIALVSVVSAIFSVKTSCQPKRSIGAYCNSNDWCKSGFCRLDKCVASLPGLNENCIDLACAEGLGCTGGLCKALPTEGGQCLESPMGPFLCAEGYACYSGICSEIKQSENSICSDFEYKCGNGLGCAFQTEASVCVKKRKEGEKCTARECAEGLYCRGDKCVPFKKKRGNCFGDRLCSPELVCRPRWILGLIPFYRCREPSSKKGTKCLDRCAGDLYCG